ncbi:MAG: HD domain-containing protein [Gemmatimonadaceae bacterium]
MSIIRDPLWNNIRVDPVALRLIDTPVFQRLRYVRQLGWAYLVYPGATHARFEHALGTYHLAGRTLRLLGDNGALRGIPAEEATIVRMAALLHDVGHYPFSHALEEIGAPHHEEVARPLITSGEVATVLRELAPDAPERVLALIRGQSDSPLQGLVSGSLDLDKIEYLNRDALMCGVPYGEIDADRLMNSLTVVGDAASGGAHVGVMEKGLSALESLLFAKYQMYRNVYWHHAVRSATAMYKRLVADALAASALEVRELSFLTDESLLHALEQRAPSALLDALRNRRLYKRAFECPAAELDADVGEWIATDRARAVRVEDELAAEFGLAPGELLLDYPEKTEMLGLDIPVVRRSGEVMQLTGAGLPGSINLTQMSEQLYRSARWLRVFVAREVNIPRARVLDVARGA